MVYLHQAVNKKWREALETFLVGVTPEGVVVRSRDLRRQTFDLMTPNHENMT